MSVKGIFNQTFSGVALLSSSKQLVAVWDDQKKKREYSWRGDYVLTLSSPEHRFRL